jgi:nitrite reductase (NADH) small subunit
MWVSVGTADEVVRARKKVIDTDDGQIVVFAHEGEFHAFDNICIHKQRELEKGVILNGRIVCPGHQWAYELTSGWCRERERFQPTHDVRIDDGVVYVETEPRTVDAPAPAVD